MLPVFFSVFSCCRVSYQHQFKARPYNPDGFGVGGEQGVFRPQHSDKTLTQPAPFRLSTDGRASKRAPRYLVCHMLIPVAVSRRSAQNVGFLSGKAEMKNGFRFRVHRTHWYGFCFCTTFHDGNYGISVVWIMLDYVDCVFDVARAVSTFFFRTARDCHCFVCTACLPG